jgi:hypothetical protein
MPLLYLYDPILGVQFDKPLDKRFETTSDFTVSLEPFYVSYNDEGEPSYNWFIDGLPTTPIGGRLLALRPKENSYGSNLLSIMIYGPDRRIQKAETSTEIIFDTRK